MADSSSENNGCANLAKASSLFNGCHGKQYGKSLHKRLRPKIVVEESDWYNEDAYCNVKDLAINDSDSISRGFADSYKQSLSNLNGNSRAYSPTSTGYGEYRNPSIGSRSQNKGDKFKTSKGMSYGNSDGMQYYPDSDNDNEDDDEYCPVAYKQNSDLNMTCSRSVGRFGNSRHANNAAYGNPAPIPLLNPVAIPARSATVVNNYKNFLQTLHTHNQKLKEENRAIKDLVKNHFCAIMDRLETQQIDLERQDQELYRLEVAIQQFLDTKENSVVSIN